MCFAPQEENITKTSFTTSRVVKAVVATKIQVVFCVSTKLVPWEFLDAILNSRSKKSHPMANRPSWHMGLYSLLFLRLKLQTTQSSVYTPEKVSAWNRSTEWRITLTQCLPQCGLMPSGEGALSIYMNTC